MSFWIYRAERLIHRQGLLDGSIVNRVELIPRCLLLQLYNLAFRLICQIDIYPTYVILEILRVISVKGIALPFKGKGCKTCHPRSKVNRGIPHGDITLEFERTHALHLRVDSTWCAKTENGIGMVAMGNRLWDGGETYNRRNLLDGGIIALHPTSTIAIIVIGIIQVINSLIILGRTHRLNGLPVCRACPSCQKQAKDSKNLLEVFHSCKG